MTELPAVKGGRDSKLSLPSWTWVAPGLITLALVLISGFLPLKPPLSLVHLPFMVSTVLVLWWGVRIFPGVFLGSAAGALILGMPWYAALLMGAADVAVPALARLLFQSVMGGDFRLPRLRCLTRFLLAGTLLPLLVGAGIWTIVRVLLGGEIIGDFWSIGLDTWVANSLWSQIVTIPALMYLSQFATARNLCPPGNREPAPLLVPHEFRSHGYHLSVLAIFGGVAALSIVIPVHSQSLVYGVFVIAAGLYFGISLAIASSIWTVLVTLFLPMVAPFWANVRLFEGPAHDIHFHLFLICAVALIVGRTSSDAREDARRRDRDQRALKDAEEKYRTLWQSVPLALFRTLPSGAFISANPAGVEMLGYESETELMQASATDHYCDLSDRLEATNKLSSEGVFLRKRMRFKRRDGSEFWASMTARATLNARGELLHYNSVVEDITAQMRAEQALRDSELKYRELVEHAKIAIAEDSPDGKLAYFNRKFAELFGYSADELRQILYSEIIHPDDFDKVSRIRQSNYDGMEPRPRMEFRGRRKDGSTIYLEASVSLLTENGRVVGNRAYLWDVTDRVRAEQSRIESEERYRRLVENASVGIVVTQAGRIVYINPTLQSSSGYTAETLIGRNFAEMLVPEDRDRSLSSYYRRHELNQPGTDTNEVRAIHRDGHIIWYSTSNCLIDWDGKPATLSFLTDITEKRRTLQALRESEEKFRLLSEQSFLGIVILQDDVIRYANAAAARVFDREQRDMVDRPFRHMLRIVHPADISAATSDSGMDCTAGGSITRQSTYRVMTRGGASRWVEQHCKPIDYGGRHATFVTLQDITERVDYVKRLTRLSAAVQQSATMISIVEIDGTVAYVNPEYCNVTGHDSDELVGRPCEMLGEPARGSRLHGEMWEAISARQTWSGNVSSRRKNGDQFWKRLTISPIVDDNDDLIGCLSVGEDMTREMRTQQKLAEVEKLSAVGMLAAGVAHEFRNYLAGIIGNASFARDDLEKSGDLTLACETLDQIVDIAEKANDLTLSLLSYSRASVHNARPENLKELIANTLRLVKKEMRVRSVTLNAVLEEVPPVDITASKIQQLLINLLINAQQAIQGAGVITVALNADDTRVSVSVSDTGAGIRRENLARVFDPFFSTKGVWGKDGQRGVGMGLAICRNIAREHGGDLTVESTVGKGTTFTLTLPLERLEGARVAAEERDGRRRVVCISLNNSVLSKYRDEAAAAGVEMVIEVPSVHDDDWSAPDLVICDARYAGKMELIRMAESCRRIAVPYVLVNCGGLDYELDSLFDSARARYAELPLLAEVMKLIEAAAAQSEVPSGTGRS